MTEFFRDPEAWQVLGCEVLGPLVQERRNCPPIRTWTAGCATGEEAYSVAMLLAEQAEATDKPCDFQVFATDASSEILARAGRGIFSEAALNGVSPERRAQQPLSPDPAEPEACAWDEAVRISHKELAASHEEFQALNEELKAVNEQLNSTNEDLTQANVRLRDKIAELEMQGRVLSSGAVMTLFLDEGQRVRWFTPAIDELFPLRADDAGRCVTDLAQKFEDAQFLSDVRAVMQTGISLEAEVRNEAERYDQT